MRTCPTRLNDSPKGMKTAEKPTMNNSELRTTFRSSLGSACERLKSSKDTPAINERYDGTRGKTQGDKNDNNPAPKATMTESSTPFIGFPPPFTFPSGGKGDLYSSLLRQPHVLQPA